MEAEAISHIPRSRNVPKLPQPSTQDRPPPAMRRPAKPKHPPKNKQSNSVHPTSILTPYIEVRPSFIRNPRRLAVAAVASYFFGATHQIDQRHKR